MYGTPDRVVRQMHRRLYGDVPAADLETSLSSQIIELQERIARIRRIGSQYANIRISRHVTALRETAIAKRRGQPVSPRMRDRSLSL
jgi:hypothetical protein